MKKETNPSTNQGHEANTMLAAVRDKKKNPFQLIWYKAEWSEARTAKNNQKFWEWEIKHNGFRCP